MVGGGVGISTGVAMYCTVVLCSEVQTTEVGTLGREGKGSDRSLEAAGMVSYNGDTSQIAIGERAVVERARNKDVVWPNNDRAVWSFFLC